jgi:hypothetical protein
MTFGLREGGFHSKFLCQIRRIQQVETVHPQIKNVIHYGTRIGGSTSLNRIDSGERFHSALNSLSEFRLFLDFFTGNDGFALITDKGRVVHVRCMEDVSHRFRHPP